MHFYWINHNREIKYHTFHISLLYLSLVDLTSYSINNYYYNKQCIKQTLFHLNHVQTRVNGAEQRVALIIIHTYDYYIRVINCFIIS